MSNEFRFDTELYENQKPYASADVPTQKSWVPTCLMGCGALLAMFLIVALIGGVFVARNIRGWASTVASQAIKQSIDSSQLPEDQKQAIKIQVERLAQAFRNRELSDEQMARLLQKFVESPIVTSVIIKVLEVKYLNNSSLSDVEKEQGRRTLQRFLRGWAEGVIPEASIRQALGKVAEELDADGDNDHWRIKQTLTDDELRAFLVEAKAAADAASVPDESFDFDPAREFQRLVDEAFEAEAPPAENAERPETPDP